MAIAAMRSLAVATQTTTHKTVFSSRRLHQRAPLQILGIPKGKVLRLSRGQSRGQSPTIEDNKIGVNHALDL